MGLHSVAGKVKAIRDVTQITDIEVHFPQYASNSVGEFMDEAFLLACKKLVLFGGAAGFSMDDMLTMLLDGMTVEQLLDIIGRGITAMDAAPPRWRM